MDLEQKFVLVTGASSGIGKAIAIGCAAAGADVAITYRRNREGAEETARDIRERGRRAEVIEADVSNEGEIASLLEELRKRLGRVDAWINNAGADILTGAGSRLSRLAKLDLLLAVDLRGTILASWAAVEMMRAQATGGTIINMSWDHVGIGMAGENPILYSAAKGGILSFSKSLARDVAPHIRVNVLAPGFIETSFGEGADEGWRREVVELTPLKRWGAPDDIAGAAVFLASDASAFVTGQVLAVNGGVV
ncbi:MAG: SDR family NAD(P)-dependent oxidoreductase [Gemmatimonadales bacterium]